MSRKQINHALQNRMVLCTGPSRGRKELLQLTYKNLDFASFNPPISGRDAVNAPNGLDDNIIPFNHKSFCCLNIS